MKHTISVLVNNRPGVLARTAGLFARRGFNIDSLAVGETQDHSISRMTIVVEGDDRILEMITKQLNKLIDVIKVVDFKGGEFVDRELVLVKVNVNTHTRPEIMQVVDIFRARIVSVHERHFIIEVTGTEGKINAFLDLVRPFGIKELARTGKVAMARV